MPNFVVSILISFIVRQIDKFQKGIDFALLEKDLNERVRALIPGTFFDDEAVALVGIVLRWVKQVLGEKDNMKDLLHLLADKKFDAAVALLKKLVLGGFVPKDVMEAKAMAFVQVA